MTGSIVGEETPSPGRTAPAVAVSGPPEVASERWSDSRLGVSTVPVRPSVLSVTDFLTDGSLAGLCAEMTQLTGIGVELRDVTGRLVVPRKAGPDGQGWMVVDAPRPGAGATDIPLMVAGRPIGSIVMEPAATPARKPSSDVRGRLDSALRLLAQAAAELCQHEVELRHRIKEIAALSRMSSLLVRAAGPDKVLEVALDSALDVLELDAGSIVLLPDEGDVIQNDSEADLVLKASSNLSRAWLESPMPLSKDRLFDRVALTGQMVIVEDVASDPRILIPERAAAEGLGAAIHAGLVFHGRPLGVIRLYSRKPRKFEDAEQRLLSSLAQQAAAALEQSRLLKFEQEEQRIQRQLQLAADVQRRLLPKGAPNIDTLDTAARYIPSFELSGDFYDFVDLSGHLGVVIGDVVGKGIAAALLMSAVRASLRAHVQEVYDIDEVVSRVNTALCQDTRDDEFASLWYGVIDPARLRLTYCSAGHEPLLVLRQAAGPSTSAPPSFDVHELSVGGMVVGIDPLQTYQRAVFDLRPGDLIVGYTDGLMDATNFSGERFGKKRIRSALLKLLQEQPSASAAVVVERLLWEVRQFAGLSPRPDDKTVIAVRVR